MLCTRDSVNLGAVQADRTVLQYRSRRSGLMACALAHGRHAGAKLQRWVLVGLPRLVFLGASVIGALVRVGDLLAHFGRWCVLYPERWW